MKRVLFASDLHARPDEPEREKIFKHFLNKEALSCDKLYLLGDLFEFGFVFRGRILPAYEPLIEEIAELIRKGVEVFFLAGNHDFWMAEYLRKRGLRIVHDGEVHEVFGRRVQMFHGLLREPDSLSRLAARIMQNPTSVWLYSLLPYRLGFSLALKAAHLSRERHATFPRLLKDSSLKPIDPRTQIIISGHHHEPLRFTYKAGTFYTTGEWFSRFTYLEMTPSGLELKAFRVDTLLCK
ncbi:MAG: UDP-2,3-diacylglucosamine diphosphatase [candidate division WOR-3 bacterium]|nr:UDP-2,3-diacylglucosamine diphosphatase [candidate division WOR-3 bacterium]